VLASAPVPALAAPVDLTPRTVPVRLTVPRGVPGRLRLVIDTRRGGLTSATTWSCWKAGMMRAGHPGARWLCAASAQARGSLAL
jgi:hypothetical protein